MPAIPAHTRLWWEAFLLEASLGYQSQNEQTNKQKLTDNQIMI
jgi:hypothetical protein